MSVQAVGAVIDLGPSAEITTAERLILILLANCHNGHTGLCCPSVERLATEGSMSTRSVRRHLSKLEQYGLIRAKKRRSKTGRQASSKYELRVTGCHPGGKTQSDSGGAIQSDTALSPIDRENQKIEPEVPPIVPPVRKSGPPSWKIGDYELPPELYKGETWRDAAIVALQLWLDFRRSAKRKAYVQSAWIADIWKRVEMTPSRLIAAVENSIAHEYQGIYEAGNGRQKPRQKTGVRIDVSKRKYQVNRATESSE